MTHACPNVDRLSWYVSTELEAEPQHEERLKVESHAAGCGDCRLALVALGLANEPGNREEEALIGWIANSRPVDALLADLGLDVGAPSPIPAPDLSPAAEVRHLPIRGSSRDRKVARPSARRWLAGATAAAAAILALAFILPGTESGGGYVLPVTSRAAEGRPAQAVAWSPFAPVRGDVVQQGDQFDSEGRLSSLRQMNRAEADGLLTALYLWRGADGDLARARALLDTRPPTASRENDRGVLHLSGQQPEAALASFEKALGSDPNLKAALFNKALALEILGRRDEAVAAWETYLSRANREPDGWVEEARERLEALRR